MLTREAVRPILFGAVIAAGAVALAIVCAKTDKTRGCGSDFASFYAAGRLAGTGQLYSVPAIRSVEEEVTGCRTGFTYFQRPPFVAAFLWPLGHLPVGAALIVWRIAGIAALIASAWLWGAPKLGNLMACAWSFPLLASFVYGQDVVFVLFALSVSLFLLTRQKPFAAGLVFTLCADKFHLFPLLFLFFLVRGKKKAAWGIGVGGAFLAAVSFAAGGLHWPQDLVRTALGSAAAPHPWDMATLHGMLYGAPHAVVLEIVWTLVILIAALYAIFRGNFTLALSAASAGGLLLGHHAYYYDLALLLPAARLAFHEDSMPVKLTAFMLVFPVVFMGSWVVPVFHSARNLALVLFFSGVIWSACAARFRPGAHKASVTTLGAVGPEQAPA